MTEYNKVVFDLRKDVIDEVAQSLPSGTSAEQAVRAIHARLDRGLPALVKVRYKVLVRR